LRCLVPLLPTACWTKPVGIKMTANNRTSASSLRADRLSRENPTAIWEAG
jgi:hypothetical protein